MQKSTLVAPVFWCAAALAACSNGSTNPNGDGHLRVQLATTGTGATAGPAFSDVSVTRGSDEIVISDVQLVARKIKLERADGTCPTPDLSDTGEADEEDADECPNLKLGPILLDPPLGTGAETSFTVDLPAGTYTELRLQIHKPSDNNKDAAFLAANPDFAGVSIKVIGTFNGTPFAFTTDISAEVETEFDQPVVLVADGTTSLTMLLDVRGWFLSQDGGALLSPFGLDQQIRSQIEQNIRHSFHAFEDEDHDGEED
jgi:hypothetical protein